MHPISTFKFLQESSSQICIQGFSQPQRPAVGSFLAKIDGSGRHSRSPQHAAEHLGSQHIWQRPGLRLSRNAKAFTLHFGSHSNAALQGDKNPEQFGFDPSRLCIVYTVYTKYAWCEFIEVWFRSRTDEVHMCQLVVIEVLQQCQ